MDRKTFNDIFSPNNPTYSSKLFSPNNLLTSFGKYKNSNLPPQTIINQPT